MLNYIIRRVGYAIVTLIFVAIVGFFLIELPPGSYLDFRLRELRTQGGDMSLDRIASLERRYGVNDPTYLRFWKWFSNFVQGDFGYSFRYERDVGELLGARLGYTMMITITTLIVSWLIAIAVGVFSATHRNTLPDYGITVLQFIGLSVPSFLLALVLMVFGQRSLGMDVGGLFSSQYRSASWSWGKFIDLLKHLWIPVVVIGASSTAWLSRVMRGNLLDVLNMQYVQTARAKGLVENRVIWKHAVRNALHPLVMVFGMSFPQIISGQTVISIVLNLPTAGPLFINALLQQDMYLAGTFLLFQAMLLVVGNLVADVLLAWLDPRIQYQ
jgi:peptide/nickel transport system permease protein